MRVETLAWLEDEIRALQSELEDLAGETGKPDLRQALSSVHLILEIVGEESDKRLQTFLERRQRAKGRNR